MLKADTDEEQQEWEQAKSHLNRAAALVAIIEEDSQRQFCTRVEESWRDLEQALQLVEQALLHGLVHQPDVSLDERITCKNAYPKYGYSKSKNTSLDLNPIFF